MKKAVIVLSGGMDSATLLACANQFDLEPIFAVSFNYGQKHSKEIEFARQLAIEHNVLHQTIDLWGSGLSGLLSHLDATRSLLQASGYEVPEGHYAQENMEATVVPNRNMVMFAIAGAVAVAAKANCIAVGVHGGDHFIYPDCRPSFLLNLSIALAVGNDGYGALQPPAIEAPFLYRSKTEIALYAIQAGLDFSKTWSCYKGGDKHCGRCGTCVERLEAINTAAKTLGYEHGADVDKTEYKDLKFWKSQANK